MFRLAIVCIVASLPILPAVAGPVFQFHVIDLGTTPDMTAAAARGVNSSGIAAGQVMTHPGSAFDPTYIYAGILNGGPIELLADAGSHKDDSASALDINDLGVVGGYYRSRYNTYQRPAIWEDRLFKMAHMLPGGDQGEVRGLSSEIDWKAVGYSSVPISTGTIFNRAVLWDKSLGTPTNLGTLSTSEYAASVAEDVNTAHQVVGSSTTDDGSVHAFLWEAASGMIDLGALPGLGSSEAKAINETGHVVGNTGGNIAFYWSPETGMIPIAGSYEAWGINNSDVIVGTAYGGAGISFAPPEPMVALSTLLSPGSSGWTLYGATDINDRWQIVGSGRNPAGQPRAWLAFPVPVNPGPNQLAENASTFATAGDLAGWTATGSGSAEVVADPADDTNYAMSLTTGSPIAIEHLVNTPSATYAVGFDFRFLTTAGELTVLLNGVELASIAAPAALMEAFTPYSLMVDQQDLFGLNDVPLTISLDGVTGSQVLIDNITLTAAIGIPEPATAGLLMLTSLGFFAAGRRHPW